MSFTCCEEFNLYSRSYRTFAQKSSPQNTQHSSLLFFRLISIFPPLISLSIPLVSLFFPVNVDKCCAQRRSVIIATTQNDKGTAIFFFFLQSKDSSLESKRRQPAIPISLFLPRKLLCPSPRLGIVIAALYRVFHKYIPSLRDLWATSIGLSRPFKFIICLTTRTYVCFPSRETRLDEVERLTGQLNRERSNRDARDSRGYLRRRYGCFTRRKTV